MCLFLFSASRPEIEIFVSSSIKYLVSAKLIFRLLLKAKLLMYYIWMRSKLNEHEKHAILRQFSILYLSLMPLSHRDEINPGEVKLQ